MDIRELENRLDSFNRDERIETLHSLRDKFNKGEINRVKSTGFVNLHCHTFFSFNAYGYSPAHIAWRAFREGLEVVGIVDFDTLDGVEEIIEAGRILNIKTVAGIETRVFIKEHLSKVINSPQEPGIYYLMGTGFYKKPEPGSELENILLKMGAVARERNLKILNKLNDFLQEIEIDYEKDVLPLTPQGNATERHIVTALDRKAREVTGGDADRLAEFWSKKLCVSQKEMFPVVNKSSDLQELIRFKLMKHGTVGYVFPEKENFLTLEEVIKMTEKTDALPTATWLDGTNEGERSIKELLQFLIKKGAALLNIIPDRNWNIKDKKEKKKKIKNLDEVIKVTNELGLPVIAGTEMNKPGQKFVDDFSVPELKPYFEDFQKGAFFVYGHTRMGMLFDKGYYSQWAEKHFPKRCNRNDFYTEAGKIIQPDYTSHDWVRIKSLLKE